ncbi:glycosyltransferase [Sphingobacterium sp. LRF_L2]|uniref:glycosyltransferase n=1 Tax=Sphingobacterium sp. LRF_L2 TaxID=3369421 RepID=UPI003F618BF8
MTITQKKGIVFLSTFPPRACGIATYTTDLMTAISDKFLHAYELIPVPIENEANKFVYDFVHDYVLNISEEDSFNDLLVHLNSSADIDLLFIQHEFGLFRGQQDFFYEWLCQIRKDIILTFHTVLPAPSKEMLEEVQAIVNACTKVIVMTKDSARLLVNDYHINPDKVIIVPHGTHLAPATDKNDILHRYDLVGKKVLSTFGLLGPGKSIETTLEALPEIIKKTPEVIFLILGMTHPTLLQQEGERYRTLLEGLVETYGISGHVRFVNEFLATEDLLSYLLVTDVYLFTSKDPWQAVSGTFSYALSTGCPIVSTPIPHALEVLNADMGIMIDFDAPLQLASAVNQILDDTKQLETIRHINLRNMVTTSWQNVAVAHVDIFENLVGGQRDIIYSFPPINLDHIFRMTTDIGLVQFAHICSPNLESGYTLDDNARALIAMLHHYKLFESYEDLAVIDKYLCFIARCLQEDGTFLNYVDKFGNFLAKNQEENLEDANGRAIWALGELLGMSDILPEALTKLASDLTERSSVNFLRYNSPRAMAFIIKGLSCSKKADYDKYVEVFADRLAAMFNHESREEWNWYESYLTYANSAIPEAMLCAYEVTGKSTYKIIAYKSFDFLLERIVRVDGIRVISNKGWAYRDKPLNNALGGEQPIDVAYTIIALDRFYRESDNYRYRELLNVAFDWFLGRNNIRQIVYNPITGGCFDGLEENAVNINQGAESTVSYLMARLIMCSYTQRKEN